MAALGGAVLLALSVRASAHEATAKAAPQTALDPSARVAAAVVDAFHGALRRGDTRAAAALLANDALIFEEGGAERTKAEYAAHHLSADAEFSKVVTSTVTRRAGGSNGALAWITSEGRMAGSYKGKALDRATTETMVLRRSAGAWKIIHIHWSSAAK
jgi:ketosteroid isomerase-like protein